MLKCDWELFYELLLNRERCNDRAGFGHYLQTAEDMRGSVHGKLGAWVYDELWSRGRHP